MEITIGIDLGDVWSHYCTLNENGGAVDRGRFRATPKAVGKWFTDLPPARVAMEAGTHSIWISEQLQERRKSYQVDAEKLARFARLDSKILPAIVHGRYSNKKPLR